MAGIIPGIILTLLFIAAIYVVVARKPELGRWSASTRDAGVPAPRGADYRYCLGDNWRHVHWLLHPGEASAVGAFLTFVVALLRRSLSWSRCAR